MRNALPLRSRNKPYLSLSARDSAFKRSVVCSIEILASEMNVQKLEVALCNVVSNGEDVITHEHAFVEFLFRVQSHFSFTCLPCKLT